MEGKKVNSEDAKPSVHMTFKCYATLIIFMRRIDMASLPYLQSLDRLQPIPLGYSPTNVEVC